MPLQRTRPAAPRCNISLKALLALILFAQLAVCVWRWEYGGFPDTFHVGAWLDGHDSAHMDILAGRVSLRCVGSAQLPVQEDRETHIPFHWEEADWCPHSGEGERDAFQEGYNAEVLRALRHGELAEWFAAEAEAKSAKRYPPPDLAKRWNPSPGNG